MDDKPQADHGQQRLTLDVPEAGARLGLGRSASYEAARRGEIPVIRIGKRLLVPTKALDRLLEAAPNKLSDTHEADETR
ncbi:MAG: helix-turn-helix domain-containing protein [Alphaproteobacteria bacterium]|nr:helix-turn-helix domain-containing protein [Alphaproteobacteria bacterium]